MDKKNTMLLTVIAVATLLVAVVGATFAYFSIVQNAEGKTQTNFTGQTEDVSSVGSATLEQGQDKLYMGLSAIDMGYAKKGTSYWATDNPNAASLETTFVSNKGDVEKYYPISTAQIKGGKEETKYRCTSKVTIAASGPLKDYVGTQGTLDEGKKIVTGDGQIKFQGIASTTAGGNAVKFDTDETTKTIDLLTLLTSDQTINLTYDITTKNSEEVSGSVGFEAALNVNNTDKDQTHMADKTLVLDITNEEFSCSVVESFE